VINGDKPVYILFRFAFCIACKINSSFFLFNRTYSLGLAIMIQWLKSRSWTVRVGFRLGTLVREPYKSLMTSGRTLGVNSFNAPEISTFDVSKSEPSVGSTQR